MKPRLQISLSPQTLAVVRRLAVLQKVPASRVVSELIEDVAPMLSKMVDTLESMETAVHLHKHGIRIALEESEREARSAAEQVLKVFDDIAAQARAAPSDVAAPPMSNRGATPPSLP